MRRELFVIMRKTLEPLIMTEALHLSNHARSARVGSRIPTVATWFFAIFLLLVGCSTDDPEYVESPVADIYNNALNALFDGNAAIAAKEFDEVERQHPYSVWATKAQIMSAYSYYLSNQYDEAILTFERYLQLHPGAKEAAYARYMIAICNYEQISDVGRDQKFTRQALDSLRIVTKRYPKSEYARDAKLKIDLTLDHLAGKEMEIGRFYLRRGIYIAALKRFRYVIERYQTTSHTPEALHRMTESYLLLGISDEAQNAAAMLGYNFPGSKWYQRSYALLTDQQLEPADKEESWLVRIWKSIF